MADYGDSASNDSASIADFQAQELKRRRARSSSIFDSISLVSSKIPTHTRKQSVGFVNVDAEECRLAGVQTPSCQNLEKALERTGVQAEEDEVNAAVKVSSSLLASYKYLSAPDSENEGPDESPIAMRLPGRPPAPYTNPYNGWEWQCDIFDSTQPKGGLLRDARVVLADNVSLACVPMRAGTALLHGYVPLEDAVVVRRILTESGRIVGKSTMDEFGRAWGGLSSISGPTYNPRNDRCITGGPHGGAAVLISQGDADIAVCGGPVILAASFCGVIGFQPSRNAIPPDGILSIEPSTDTIGIISRTVYDAWSMFDTLTQPTRPNTPLEKAQRDGELVTLVKLSEGFHGITTEVSKYVNRALSDIQKEIQCEIIESCLNRKNAHSLAQTVWRTIMLEESTIGAADESLQRVLGNGFRSSARDLQPATKMVAIYSEYMRSNYCNAHLTRAQQLRTELGSEYDKLLLEGNSKRVLVMPTTYRQAPFLPEGNCTLRHRLNLSMGIHDDRGNLMENIGPFLLSGHPMLTVPVEKTGSGKGKMPIGLLLVGRRGDDSVLLRLAREFENRPQAGKPNRD